MAKTPEEIDEVTESRFRSTKQLELEQKQLEKNIENQKQLVELDANDAKEKLRLIGLKEKLLELDYRILKATDASVEALLKKREEIEKNNKANEKRAEGLKLVIKLQENSKTTAKDLGKSLAGITPIIGGNADVGNSYASSLALTIQKEMGLKNALRKSFKSWRLNTQGVQGSLNTLNFLKQGLMGWGTLVIGLAKEMNTLNAEFNKATGEQRAFNLQLTQNTLNLASTGQSAAETAAVMTDLRLNMTAFTMQTEATQNELIETTGTLQALGVAATTTTKNIHFMTTALAMSADEATDASRHLFTAAQELQVGPGEMADEFASAAPKLAAFGKEAIDTFIDLKEVAKKTGVELQTLLGITEKFDTFEGAAETVGKLNAMLGGPFLNTIDMVSVTDPAERMLMLRDAVSDAGVAFEDMTFYQKKAIADAAGMEVSDMGALMAGDLEALGLASSESADKMEELREATAYTKDVGKELHAAFLNVMISIEPLIRVVQGLLFAFNWLVDGARSLAMGLTSGTGITGAIAAMVPGIILSTGLTYLLYRQFKKFAELLLVRFPAAAMNAEKALSNLGNESVKLAITELGASVATKVEEKALEKLAEQSESTIENIDDLTKSNIETSVSMGGTSIVSKILDSVLKKLRGTAGTTGVALGSTGTGGVAAAGGIGATGTASGLAVGPTLAFGAAALMVGAGVLLAAAGLALFVASFSLLEGGQIAGVAVSFGILAVAFYFLAPAIGALGAAMAAAGWVAVLGLLAIGAAALMTGAGLGLVVASFALLFAVAGPLQIFKSAISMFVLAGALSALATSFLFFAPVAGVALPILLGIGAAVLMIGTGIGLAAAGMSMMVGSVGAIAGLGSAGAEALSEMSEAINDIETEKAVVFSVAMKDTAKFVEAISAMGTSPNQAIAFVGGGAGGGAPTVVNVSSEIKGDMRKLFELIDSRVEQQINQS